MRCFACPAFLPCAPARTGKQACKEARQAAGREAVRQARDEGGEEEGVFASHAKKETRGSALAAEANYNFAWRRGSARGCVTELRARRRHEEKKETDGATDGIISIWESCQPQLRSKGCVQKGGERAEQTP